MPNSKLPDQFYVYTHMEDGEVVYVGKGVTGRCWITTNRNEDHRDWMESKLPNMEYEIVSKGLSSEDAYKEEAKLINELRPKFNKTLCKLVNVTDAETGEVIAEGVPITTWAADNGYEYKQLQRVASGKRNSHKGLRVFYL